MAEDPHRPRYHFLPPAHWMNDPNGLIYFGGRYHLFYQHNPNGPFWGTMHWGHAVSPDLVRWTHLPIALAPTPDGPDKDGCFSGCAVDHDGVPTLVYTGVWPEVQCLATSHDGMLTWQKHPANPVIAGPPPGLEVTGFRDPWVWRENGEWRMVIGSGLRGVGGAALLYRSADLVRWEYLHPLYVGEKERTGEVWECPNFFPLGKKQVLIISPVPLRKSLYLIGACADGRFTPEREGVLDAGGHFYAPQTLLDATGRRVMFGWLWEGRDEASQRAAGWAGVQSLPRVLTLTPDGDLGIKPLPELAMLRGTHRRYESLPIRPDAPLLERGGDCLELAAQIVPGAARTVGLRLCCSPGKEEETRVLYNHEAGTLAVDRERSSQSPETKAHRDQREAPFVLAPGEPLRLRVFLDRSVIEVYANDRCCLTSRIYPSRPDSLGIGLLAEGGSATCSLLDVWEIKEKISESRQ